MTPLFSGFMPSRSVLKLSIQAIAVTAKQTAGLYAAVMPR